MKIFRLITIILPLILTSCRSVQIEPAPSPPKIINIGITPSLVPLLQEKLYRCAQETTEMAMILDVVPIGTLSKNSYDIIIRIGLTSVQINQFAIQLGWEEIYLVSSPDVNLSSFSPNKVREVFSSEKPDFNILTYPPDNEIRQMFNHSFDIEKITPYAVVIPDPSLVLKVLQDETQSIGYLPKSWLLEYNDSASLEYRGYEEIKLPILALTHNPTEAPTTTFLGCLQRDFLSQDNETD